ncbi:MAG TPA: hypothetical protein VH482_30495 [Thermomicrobiales bacterium]|jgi:hypothetical protein
MVATEQRTRTRPRRTRPILVRRTAGPRVRVLTEEEAKDLFDQEARYSLGISGEEFLRRYDAGEYRDETDMDVYHKINRLVMMMPLVRSVRF